MKNDQFNLNNLKNSRGFSLVEVAVASVFISIVGVSLVQVSLLNNKDDLKLKIARRALSHRDQIDSNLKNPVAWNRTITSNSSFACFNTTSGCSLNAVSGSNGFYNFIIYDANVDSPKKISYDITDLKTRIGLNQEFCLAGTPIPDKSCPLRYEARWKPVCAVYPCTQAQVQIEVLLRYDFSSEIPFNSQRYDMSVLRDFDNASVQAACQGLNGIYNPVNGFCIPKHANKKCTDSGFQHKIVSTIQSDGSITCAPLYTGQCDPNTQLMSGISTSGVALCTARPPDPPSCTSGDKNCEGSFGACSATACGTTGNRFYTVATLALGSGAPCPFATGDPDPLGCSAPACGPVDCVGNWGSCSPSCDPGIQTFNITTPAANGGVACIPTQGQTRTCNNGACGSPIDCVGGWRSCNTATGIQTFSIFTPATGGGLNCSATDGQTRNCDVDCVGAWSTCKGIQPLAYKEFIITTTARNFGATCAYPNGHTDPSTCNSLSCTIGGSWSTCDPNLGLETWILDIPPVATNCIGGTTRPCAVNCVGDWGPCQGGVEKFLITVPAKNGGVSCQYVDGFQRACNAPVVDCTTNPFELAGWDTSWKGQCCANAYQPDTFPQWTCDGPGTAWRQISVGSCGATNTTCINDHPFGLPPATCSYSGPGTICTDR